MLKPFISGLVLATTFSTTALAEAPTQVVFETSKGNIQLELDAEKAPITVANFLKYVDKGHYDGVIFHRVIPGFMIQGGGFTPDMVKLDTDAPIKHESENGLSNLRGTIAMARTNDPDSAAAQFFINTVDNRRLDGMPGRPGYTVFGKVTQGMDVVDSIGKVSTGRQGRFQDVPTTPILINKASLIAD
ncbi:peptidylprolyl isomerase [Marinobacterium marinum]|uniref:Peptidyl-prolyl cis-trans isomerase n=1 Tax=Marinobacterium marinum TaxID=2756129 RepID=A0A7W2ACK5_9GAMM|nr:peptidylprolyl isomerase [Marinobacterium marinum]MBA4502183.1 peptidyl-prolyl cis-trans isomerase [Marinobacterium marinum]